MLRGMNKGATQVVLNYFKNVIEIRTYQTIKTA